MDDAASAQDRIAVAAVLGGERNAFASLVERYGGRLLAYCRSRTGSDEEASDAAQEILVRAYSSLATFRIEESFPAWLFAIAANHLRRRFRSSLTRSKVQEAAQALAVDAQTASAEDEVERALTVQAVRDAAGSLPEALRRPVELYYFAELSVGETARALGLGEEAVKSRLHRARAAMRRFFEKSGRSARRGGL